MDAEDTRTISVFNPNFKPKKLPYNEKGDIVRLEDLKDITSFDLAFTSVTAGLPKPIRLGSILRLAETVLPNWGIQVTGENQEDIRVKANSLYEKDDVTIYTPANTRNDQLHAFKRQLHEAHLDQMKRMAALQVVNMMKKGLTELNICHLATGAADVVMLIAEALRTDSGNQSLLEKTVFHIVDYPDRIALADKSLRKLGNIKTRLHANNEAQFFNSVQEKFDFVVSISQLHRRPFLSDYLGSIGKIMKDNGVFIAADWHSPLTLYPYHVHGLLAQLGLDNARLDYFTDLFGPLMYESMYDNATKEQLAALNDHMGYWTRLAAETKTGDHERSLRVRIMSAFMTHQQLEAHLDKGGFETDRAKIAAAFPSAKLPSTLPINIKARSDTAMVTIGIKRR